MITTPEFFVMLVRYFLDFFICLWKYSSKVRNSLVMTRDKRFLCVWMLFYVNNFCQIVNEDAKILTDG